MSDYPEHDKLKACKGEVAAISRFLDWLDDGDAHPQVITDPDGDEYRISKMWFLARYSTTLDKDGYVAWKDTRFLDSITMQKAAIIGLFVGVDPVKLEAEKCRLLASLRDDPDVEVTVKPS